MIYDKERALEKAYEATGDSDAFLAERVAAALLGARAEALEEWPGRMRFDENEGDYEDRAQEIEREAARLRAIAAEIREE